MTTYGHSGASDEQIIRAQSIDFVHNGQLFDPPPNYRLTFDDSSRTHPENYYNTAWSSLEEVHHG